MQKQLDSYSPLMSMLGMRYGIKEPDVTNVMEAIEADNSFWEEQAMKENMTVDQLKHMRKLEAETSGLWKLDGMQKIRQRDDTYERWDRESEQCKQLFPQFDMRSETNNPQFVKLLGVGFDITSAYKAVHFDMITRGMMHRLERTQRNE